jgi:hypothetical protein
MARETTGVRAHVVLVRGGRRQEGRVSPFAKGYGPVAGPSKEGGGRKRAGPRWLPGERGDGVERGREA